MISKFYQNIEVTAGGGTTSLLSTSPVETIRIFSSGVVVLAGNVTITDDGLWVEGNEIEIKYTATLTKGAFSVTIFGYSLTAEQAAAGNLIIKAYNIGGAYMTTVIASAGAAQFGTTDMAAKAITLAKMADLTAGNMILGDGSNRPSALDISADAAIPFGQGGGAVAAHVVTGDISVIKTGVSAIGSKVIVNGDISDTAGMEVKKLEAMHDGEIITGNTGGGNIATIVPSSADVLVANTGAMTVQADVITPEKATTNLNTQTESLYINLAIPAGKYSIKMGDNFALQSVSGINNVAIVANCSIAIDIGGVPVTGGTTSWTAADPINTQKPGTAITAANTGAAGATVNFTVTTGGGETAIINLSLVYKKTS